MEVHKNELLTSSTVTYHHHIDSRIKFLAIAVPLTRIIQQCSVRTDKSFLNKLTRLNCSSKTNKIKLTSPRRKQKERSIVISRIKHKRLFISKSKMVPQMQMIQKRTITEGNYKPLSLLKTSFPTR